MVGTITPTKACIPLPSVAAKWCYRTLSCPLGFRDRKQFNHHPDQQCTAWNNYILLYREL